MHDSCIVAVTCVSILAQVSTCPHIVVVLLRSSGDDARYYCNAISNGTERQLMRAEKQFMRNMNADNWDGSPRLS